MLRFKCRKDENRIFFDYGVRMCRMYDYTIHHELIKDVLSECLRNPNRTPDDILIALERIQVCMRGFVGGTNVPKKHVKLMSTFDSIYPTVKCGSRRKMHVSRQCTNILSPLTQNILS